MVGFHYTNEVTTVMDNEVTPSSVVTEENHVQELPEYHPIPKRRKGGRQRDPIWNDVTLDGRDVLCIKCSAIIHRYGATKVERVRAHFLNRCPATKSCKRERNREGHTRTLRTEDVHDNSTENGVNMLSTDQGSSTFKRRFAEWIYTSGQPFSEASNPMLCRVFRALRPDVVLPTSSELENELLDFEYANSVTKVHQAVAGKVSCLTLESWMDVNEETVTNCTIYCEGSQYFLKTITTAQEVDNEILVEEIEQLLGTHKKMLIYSIMTLTNDTLSTISRDRIRTTAPNCVFYYGCVAHALNQIMSNMYTNIPWMGVVQESVLLLIHTLQKNASLGNIFRNLQSTAGKETFSMLDEVSICEFLNLVLKSENELVELVSRNDFMDSTISSIEIETRRRLQHFVLGETFAQDVLNALNILFPIQQHLTIIQREQVSMSFVFHCYTSLIQLYEQMDFENNDDQSYVLTCIKDVFNSILGECHGIAYLLDPIYVGENMEESIKQHTETFMATFCNKVLRAEGVDILDQLTKYHMTIEQLKTNNRMHWELLVSGKVSPYEFWLEQRQFPQLQQLACVVFMLPVAYSRKSLIPSTRIIDSKFHGNLPDEKIHKLAHIYCNSKQQQTKGKESDTSFMSMVLNEADYII